MSDDLIRALNELSREIRASKDSVDEKLRAIDIKITRLGVAVSSLTADVRQLRDHTMESVDSLGGRLRLLDYENSPTIPAPKISTGDK